MPSHGCASELVSLWVSWLGKLVRLSEESLRVLLMLELAACTVPSEGSTFLRLKEFF